MMLTESKKKPPIFHAKIIRGRTPSDDDFDTRRRIEQEREIVPKGVQKGRIQLERDEKLGVIGLNYDPVEYGIVKVETIEEREQRFKADVARLKKEAEEREKKGYQKGHDQGYEEGLETGRNEIVGHIEKMRELCESTVTATRDYFTQVEERLVNFAMSIAKRVVGKTAEEHRDVAFSLAAEAIRQAIDKTRLLILVNPKDYESLKDARGDLQKVAAGIKEIEIDVDEDISPGGVILETVGGSIDATIDTMLDEVYKVLIPEYENRNGGETGQ